MLERTDNTGWQACTLLSQPVSQVRQQSARYRPEKHQADPCNYTFKWTQRRTFSLWVQMHKLRSQLQFTIHQNQITGVRLYGPWLLSTRCVSTWHFVQRSKKKVSVTLDYKLPDSLLNSCLETYCSNINVSHVH